MTGYPRARASKGSRSAPSCIPTTSRATRSSCDAIRAGGDPTERRTSASCARTARELWVRASAAVVRDAAGQPRFVVGAVVDLTEQRAEGPRAAPDERLPHRDRRELAGGDLHHRPRRHRQVLESRRRSASSASRASRRSGAARPSSRKRGGAEAARAARARARRRGAARARARAPARRRQHHRHPRRGGAAARRERPRHGPARRLRRRDARRGAPPTSSSATCTSRARCSTRSRARSTSRTARAATVAYNRAWSELFGRGEDWIGKTVLRHVRRGNRARARRSATAPLLERPSSTTYESAGARRGRRRRARCSTTR